MGKIYDCITFFKENFITNIRFEILNKFVDYFVVCESLYDHRGKKKKLNFLLKNKKFKKKIIYLVLKTPFFEKKNLWKNQAQQREYLLEGVKHANLDDLILFSDPDEIPDLKNFKINEFKKKYVIFEQKCFSYKFNILNPHETPWEGTRGVRFKNLKSFDYMRQKVLKKNCSKFWKINKETSIQIVKDGGWHFNNLLTAKQISLKLKTFAHKEYSSEKFSNPKIIREKILKKVDLFNRNNEYFSVNLKKYLPFYIYKNKAKFKKWIAQ